ncbi:PAS domain-containing protein [Maribacter sp. 2210JD10-5]|uniref:PAS domain-containing protein n=1 Tax=Maribacter sp. 2210JD10-5 TaxID=3386272 RepID=UPI0039BC7A28
MSDIRNYDDAVGRFHDTLNFNTLPVSAWDIYADYFDKTCKTAEDIKGLTKLAKTNDWEINDAIFEDQLREKEHVIVVTDAKLNIVYATQNIWQMNRYKPEEIMGFQPKIFQGEGTCKETIQNISKAIRAKKPFEANVLNYRKDGETYNCWIQAKPVFDTKGEIVNFIAFEREVA